MRSLPACLLRMRLPTRQSKQRRGRIYLLLGPPDERELDPVQKEGRGEIRWIYRGSPVTGAGPHRIVAFRRDPSGEFRLSTNPQDYSFAFSFTTRPSIILSPVISAVEGLRQIPGATDADLRRDLTQMEKASAEEALEALALRRGLEVASERHRPWGADGPPGGLALGRLLIFGWIWLRSPAPTARWGCAR